MNGSVALAAAALGLAGPLVRRRSVAVGSVTAQALVLAVSAIVVAADDRELLAGGALLVRAILLGALLLFVIRNTREPRPVRADAGPLARGAVAVLLALALTILAPPLGFDPDVQRAALTIIAFAIVTVATRRATLLQIVGIVSLENGVALAALSAPGLSGLIEVGVAADLIVLVLTAAVLHTRIHDELGTGDSGYLRSLRD